MRVQYSININTLLERNLSQHCSKHLQISLDANELERQHTTLRRWHRSFKATLMCHNLSWPDMPAAVFLGLRTCFKADIQATTTELVYGSSIRLPNEFF